MDGSESAQSDGDKRECAQSASFDSRPSGPQMEWLLVVLVMRLLSCPTTHCVHFCHQCRLEGDWSLVEQAPLCTSRTAHTLRLPSGHRAISGVRGAVSTHRALTCLVAQTPCLCRHQRWPWAVVSMSSSFASVPSSPAEEHGVWRSVIWRCGHGGGVCRLGPFLDGSIFGPTREISSFRMTKNLPTCSSMH